MNEIKLSFISGACMLKKYHFKKHKLVLKLKMFGLFFFNDESLKVPNQYNLKLKCYCNIRNNSNQLPGKSYH